MRALKNCLYFAISAGRNSA